MKNIDTDTDTLKTENSILILLLILFTTKISILIRYRYDIQGQKYRSFDTDTIVSKVSVFIFTSFYPVVRRCRLSMVPNLTKSVKILHQPCLNFQVFAGRPVYGVSGGVSHRLQQMAPRVPAEILTVTEENIVSKMLKTL